MHNDAANDIKQLFVSGYTFMSLSDSIFKSLTTSSLLSAGISPIYSIDVCSVNEGNKNFPTYSPT